MIISYSSYRDRESVFFFLLFFFLGLHPRHVEVPKLGVKSKLQLLGYPQPQQ